MQINFLSARNGLIAALLLLIFVLAGLLYQQGPRVRSVQFEDGFSESARTEGSIIRLKFDRPIQQLDYTDLISISPEVDFTTQTLNQEITLRISQNLQHQTEYNITLAPGVADQSNKPMRDSYTYSFETAPARYIYLERNYEEGVADDFLITNFGESVTNVLFAHENITMFDANSDFAIVAVREETQDNLITINLETGETTTIQGIIRGRIGDLVLARESSIALFTVTPDFNAVSRQFYEQYRNRPEAVDVETGSLFALTNEVGENFKVFSTDIDTFGRVALVQSESEEFFAISPYDDYDPVLLGSHSASFGLSSDASEIIFRDLTVFSRYDIASADLTEVSFDVPGFVKDIESVAGSTYISSSLFLAGNTTEFISIQDGEEFVELWSSGDSTDRLRNFATSYDESRLAIQLNPDKCRFDSSTANSQCQDTRTEIFNIETGEVEDVMRGFGLVWLP